MKILIINTSDSFGGAARATYRLHRSLLREEINSEMLVQQKLGDDYTVSIYQKSFFQKLIGKLRPLIDVLPLKVYKRRSATLFSPSWFGFSNIVDKINSFEPDIVHLHWICGGMIRIEDLRRIKAPIVWTLHDNWAFTGGCHIMWDCERFKQGCGACPRLGSDKVNDLSSAVFKRKEKIFSQLPEMTIVALSKWMENNIKSSPLLGKHRVVNIGNPIDTSIFKPMKKMDARVLWNFPQNKKLLLFGAISATSDINKGYSLLLEALNTIEDCEIEFIVFGSSEPKEKVWSGIKTHYLGHLSDDISLASLYSAVDIMIIPSLQEAFGQTATESMACGTPVVAFAHTGILDIVEHKKTGYLAKSYDTQDLAFGIKWILNESNYDQLANEGRKKIVDLYDSSLLSRKYSELYRSLLTSNVNKE